MTPAPISLSRAASRSASSAFSPGMNLRTAACANLYFGNDSRRVLSSDAQSSAERIMAVSSLLKCLSRRALCRHRRGLRRDRGSVPEVFPFARPQVLVEVVDERDARRNVELENLGLAHAVEV